MSQKTQNKGFTLVEILLVTVIIGILAGSVVLVFTGRATQARINRAYADIKSYQTALDSYALDHNDQYPNSLKELTGGKIEYISVLKKDPWGNAYIYEKPGKKHPKSYDIYSLGPDGQKGTEDDIAEWLNNN